MISILSSLVKTIAFYVKEKSNETFNVYRFKTFERIDKPKLRGKNPLDKLKGTDASGIPPCEREVAAHIECVSFVSRMLANADKPIIQQHPSVDDGWELVEDQYKPIWFQGDQLPDSLFPDEEELADADDDEVLAQSSSDEEDVEGHGDDADN